MPFPVMDLFDFLPRSETFLLAPYSATKLTNRCSLALLLEALLTYGRPHT